MLFLLYDDVNQFYIYTYPLPLRPSSDPHSPSHPPRSLRGTELSSLPQTAGSQRLRCAQSCVWQSRSPGSGSRPAPRAVSTRTFSTGVSVPALRTGSSIHFESSFLTLFNVAECGQLGSKHVFPFSSLNFKARPLNGLIN